MEFDNREIFKLYQMNIAHERSVCRNPPTHNFTGDRRNVTDTLKYVTFLGKHTDK
jgi:hypothetical protein